MNQRKIRKYPPMAVAAAALTIFSLAAVGAVSRSAQEIPGQAIKEPFSQSAAENGVPQELQAPAVTMQIAEIADKATAKQAEPQEPESAACAYDWSGEEKEMLAKIIMAEAEGESTEGKALVGLVVLNRVLDKQFPDTIEEVIFQPRQFSVVTEGGRYYTTEPDAECYEALELVLSGWDESYGALYFESCAGSSWHSRNLEFVFEFGNHKFYR